jgi:glycosyltransferase involved in cell wall biosynthesis
VVEPTPFVSIIVPIYNEADCIEQCLNSIIENSYPADRTEVLVIDGMSNDGTSEIVRRIESKNARIHLLNNPQRFVSQAMNRGILEAKGSIIIRVDGHATIDPDFILRNVRSLEEHPEAWCVGGPVESMNSTLVGKAIAAAMSSPIGVGNAMFRLGNYEGYVDTIAFGAYRRWVFDRIGLFDEELVRNQDDELNLRIWLVGGKIYMNPAIRSRYYPRVSLKKLGRQYYQYGFWRVRTIQKHRRPATLRQIAPFVFVCLWILLVLSAIVSYPGKWGLVSFTTFYCLALLTGMIGAIRRGETKSGFLTPIIFPILHFAYGLGSLAGVGWWVLLRRKTVGGKGHIRISR